MTEDSLNTGSISIFTDHPSENYSWDLVVSLQEVHSELLQEVHSELLQEVHSELFQEVHSELLFLFVNQDQVNQGGLYC